MHEEKSDQEALFEVMRFQLLTAAIAPGTREKFDDAYVYAWNESIYPLEHQKVPWHTPFKNVFEFPAEFMRSVRELFDYSVHRFSDGDDKLDFHHLVIECYHIAQNHKVEFDPRCFVRVCKYFFLCGTFYPEFWHNVISSEEAPEYTNEICASFERVSYVRLG